MKAAGRQPFILAACRLIADCAPTLNDLQINGGSVTIGGGPASLAP